MQLDNGAQVSINDLRNETLAQEVTVYNFEGEDNHTYYVSESNILCHNMCKLKGMQNAKVKFAATIGREMHKNWNFGKNIKKEIAIPGAGRADGVNFNKKIIYELKPNNSRAIKLGNEQLKRYAEGMSKWKGGKWTTKLVTYK